jgi:hypothetical protein
MRKRKSIKIFLLLLGLLKQLAGFTGFTGFARFARSLFLQFKMIKGEKGQRTHCPRSGKALERFSISITESPDIIKVPLLSLEDRRESVEKKLKFYNHILPPSLRRAKVLDEITAPLYFKRVRMPTHDLFGTLKQSPGIEISFSDKYPRASGHTDQLLTVSSATAVDITQNQKLIFFLTMNDDFSMVKWRIIPWIL